MTRLQGAKKRPASSVCEDIPAWPAGGDCLGVQYPLTETEQDGTGLGEELSGDAGAEAQAPGQSLPQGSPAAKTS
jgi:hypothetical protein